MLEKSGMYITAEVKLGKTFITRLMPGQELVEGISQFLKDQNVKAGFIPVLQGGFKELRLISMKPGESVDHPQDVEQVFKEPLEYFGMGTIATVDGKPSIHIHLAAARGDKNHIGGHLVSADIVLLTEIVVQEVLGVDITRQPDPKVFNYPLLKFE